MDNRFKVKLVSASINPAKITYTALHQDYCEDFVMDDPSKIPNETQCNWIVVKRLLEGKRNHWGSLEHAQIVLNVGYFPHSTMQQLRTHRVGVSFDVQSFRYTGNRICKVASGQVPLEDVFYLRPIGMYHDRNGKKYCYTESQRSEDLALCLQLAQHYALRCSRDGFSEEQARSLIPFDTRQHFVMSANARSLLHMLDLRWKKDAQQECQDFCELVFPIYETWFPAVAEWYMKNRAKKALLAP